MKCDFLNPTDPAHCWHWTGHIVEFRLPEHLASSYEKVMRAIGVMREPDLRPAAPQPITPPVAERFCCHCGRRGLAVPSTLFTKSHHGPWLEMRRGRSARYAKHVA